MQLRQQFKLPDRFDLKIVEACVGGVTIFATGSLIASGMNAHARFTELAIMIKPGWGLFEKEYDYDRVREVAAVKKFTAPSGNVRESPHYAILFDDGTTWNTGDGFWTSGSGRDKQIMEFVAKKARLPLREVDLLEDLRRPRSQAPPDPNQ